MTSRILATVVFSLFMSPALLADTNAARLIRKPDKWFESEKGLQVLDCILSWQTEHGDWPKQDTTKKPYTGYRKKLRGTFDNGQQPVNLGR